MTQTTNVLTSRSMARIQYIHPFDPGAPSALVLAPTLAIDVIVDRYNKTRWMSLVPALLGLGVPHGLWAAWGDFMACLGRLGACWAAAVHLDLVFKNPQEYISNMFQHIQRRI